MRRIRSSNETGKETLYGKIYENMDGRTSSLALVYKDIDAVNKIIKFSHI